MNFETKLAPARALLFASLLFAIVACSGKPPPVSPTPTAAPDAAPAQPLAADSTSWTPEALEDLLAPVALYPDPVLAQLLVAVTNPQEVLDAGNWLIAHPDLKGKPLDTAAQAAGFTLTMRSVMQFPEVVDKLCMNMPWTEELGQAYVNDQQGVMDAVQRLRAQAQSVGTLKSSPQMKVTTEKQAGGDVIALEPAKPNVVAVPQYDPVIVYAQAPAPAATTTTTTTTTTKEDDGHSTESMIATGVLAFGAGLLVSEIFDDDDYYNHGYYGNMWHGPMPYYPPYPYRPVYGGGYYPGNAYNRPNNYVRNNTVIVNNNNNYFNRYNSPSQVARTRQQPSSPISAARPNRPELNQLNAKAAQGPARRAPSTSEALRGKGGYTGTDPKVKQTMDRQASQVAAKAAPKVQGTYAGAKPDRAKPAAAARPATASTPQRDAARPAQAQRPAQTNRPNADRGYAGDARASAAQRPDAQRPAQRPDLQGPTSTPAVRPQPQANRSAMSGGGGGGSFDHAASARGRQSMPSGGAAKARAKPRRR